MRSKPEFAASLAHGTGCTLTTAITAAQQYAEHILNFRPKPLQNKQRQQYTHIRPTEAPCSSPLREVKAGAEEMKAMSIAA